eukprot:2828700-Prymnesium_polylepis.1
MRSLRRDAWRWRGKARATHSMCLMSQRLRPACVSTPSRRAVRRGRCGVGGAAWRAQALCIVRGEARCVEQVRWRVRRVEHCA